MRSGFIAVRASGPLGLAGKAFWHPLPTEISVSRSPRRRQLAVQAAPDEARLVAALLQESTDKNTETVMRAVEELRMLAAVYGGGRTRAAQGGLPLADKINDYLPKIGSGRSDRSGRLIPLLDHLSDLFVRAQQHGDPQQRRLLLSRYADTLTKLASLLSENYYGDILRNPGYWSDPEQRLSQVLNAVAAVDQEVLENIRQLSESRDIEFKVALESLTRPQNGAKLSDVYHDRSP